LMFLDKITCNIDSWSSVLVKFHKDSRELSLVVVEPIWRQCVEIVNWVNLSVNVQTILPQNE